MDMSARDNVYCPTQVHHNASSRVVTISKPSRTNLSFLIPCMITTNVFQMWDIKICLQRGWYYATYLLLTLLKLYSNFHNPPISGTKNHLTETNQFPHNTVTKTSRDHSSWLYHTAFTNIIHFHHRLNNNPQKLVQSTGPKCESQDHTFHGAHLSLVNALIIKQHKTKWHFYSPIHILHGMATQTSHKESMQQTPSNITMPWYRRQQLPNKDYAFI